MSLTTDGRVTSGSRKVAVACGAAVLLLTSACGSKDDGNQNASGGTYQRGPQGAPDSRIPGANGKVAAVDGITAQVQGADGQVAVTWTGSTTFTKEVAAALADVKVSSCVIVRPAGEPASGSTPDTEITAASVRIVPNADGSCVMRAPGGPSGPGEQGGSDGGPQLDGTPPSDAPGGGGRPQVRTIGGAVGEVTGVSSTGFTVDSVTPASDGKTSVTVTVGTDTTYTATAAGAASDVKVGVCLAATGTTDETGAVTAETVNLSQPVDGQCGGLMRFKSGGGGSASTQGS
jgi:hypothetical protein